ncbi:hypothetical protein [Stakelama marina]|uniref:Uncharacterized protein n=1 Tax=Stakelama marina TaxID=2826939 RepID=A0A8T4IDX2_9SPHN|nr:hypothetical protein [Stakelama marina]MBR0551195.1 hypothetical protein [Stakelama marina]
MTHYDRSSWAIFANDDQLFVSLARAQIDLQRLSAVNCPQQRNPFLTDFPCAHRYRLHHGK